MKPKLTCIHWKKTCYRNKGETCEYRNRKIKLNRQYLIMISLIGWRFEAGEFQKSWRGGPLRFPLGEGDLDLSLVREVWEIRIR